MYSTVICVKHGNYTYINICYKYILYICYIYPINICLVMITIYSICKMTYIYYLYIYV